MNTMVTCSNVNRLSISNLLFTGSYSYTAVMLVKNNQALQVIIMIFYKCSAGHNRSNPLKCCSKFWYKKNQKSVLVDNCNTVKFAQTLVLTPVTVHLIGVSQLTSTCFNSSKIQFSKVLQFTSLHPALMHFYYFTRVYNLRVHSLYFWTNSCLCYLVNLRNTSSVRVKIAHTARSLFTINIKKISWNIVLKF